jgi:hypothetical protein
VSKRLTGCVTVLILTLTASAAFAGVRCGSFVDPGHRSMVDFAPLSGFVDVCSKDVLLCTALTQGYPPSITTIGYFVPVDDWQRYQRGDRSGFPRYLIGQRASSWSAAEFATFKQYLHSTQGITPDHTALVDGLASQGRAPLGIVNEGPAFISFGVVMQLSATEGPGTQAFYLASINAALQLHSETLTLYAFDKAAQLNDGGGAKSLMTSWLRCIMSRNSASHR